MKICVRSIAIVFILAFVLLMLTACGDKNDGSTKDEAKYVETVSVVETTADDGVIVKDKDGNKITVNKESKIISVEDKNGEPVSVEEYLVTHTWVEEYVSEKIINPDNGKNSDKSDNKSEKSNSKAEKSADGGEEVTEGEIPTAMATVPDVDDQEVIPDV